MKTSGNSAVGPIDGKKTRRVGHGEPSVEQVRNVAERLTDTGTKVQEDAEELTSSLQDMVFDLRDVVRETVQTRPYVAVGIAAVTGFALGGGLSVRVGRMLFGLGGRLAVNAALREVLKS